MTGFLTQKKAVLSLPFVVFHFWFCIHWPKPTSFFDWGVIALQWCGSFSCTTWISHKCTSVIFSFASLLLPSDYFLLFLVEDNTHLSLNAFQTNSVYEKVLYGSVFECIYSVHSLSVCTDFPGGSDSKESCNTGDMDLIPGLGRSSWGGHGDPLQYFCLENPHGQRSLEDCRPWSSVESEMTWVTKHSSCICKSNSQNNFKI